MVTLPLAVVELNVKKKKRKSISCHSCLQHTQISTLHTFVRSCRQTDSDSVWPPWRGDVSGSLRVVHRRRLLRPVRIQRCHAAPVVLEWKAEQHRREPRQWVHTHTHTPRECSLSQTVVTLWFTASLCKVTTSFVWPGQASCIQIGFRETVAPGTDFDNVFESVCVWDSVCVCVHDRWGREGDREREGENICL